MEKLNDTINDERERHLWKQAKKRVEFRQHLYSYIIINGMFWAIWFFTGRNHSDYEIFPWPVWPMLGWGIGIAFDAYNTYWGSSLNSVEREYEKLKNRDRS